MKPRPFDYLRPASVAEAIDALAAHGEDGRILAGGQSLLPMLNFRIVEAETIIDIGGLAELDFIRRHEGSLEVGAAVTQSRLLADPMLAEDAPLLAAVLPFVGHFQTRNSGTVCGSIAHADPSAEIPLALAVMEGEVELRSTRGSRRVKAGEFQQGLLATARAPDELILSVRLPLARAPRGVAFREVARRHGDFAIVSVAALVDDSGLRVGIGGMADRPVARRLDETNEDAVARAFDALAQELGGYEDMHASPRLRRDMLRRLGPIVVREALQCAA